MRTITLCFDKANRTYAATRLIFQTASSEYTSADNSFVSFLAPIVDTRFFLLPA